MDLENSGSDFFMLNCVPQLLVSNASYRKAWANSLLALLHIH